MQTAIAEFKNVSKIFNLASGEFRALDGISFSIQSGSIHALLGENGAGKSTLMKILFGLYEASQGSVYFQGKKADWSSALQAQRAGIGMVHQHFMLAESETALDNVALHALDLFSSFGVILRDRLAAHLKNLEKSTGLSLDWQKKVVDLSVGEQQRLEIIKALIRPTKLLILDEPTAVLTPNEVSGFLQKLKELKASGVTILLITHKLKEVMACADRASVLRAGKLVGTVEVANTSEADLAMMMMGHKAIDLRARVSTEQRPLIQVSNSLYLNSGEILGIAGVEGNGQNELMLKLIRTDWGKLNVAFMPPDRLRQAMAADLDLQENVLLSPLLRKRFSKGLFWDRQALRQYCIRLLEVFDVRPRNSLSKIADLSGGNQQKFVAGREILQGRDLDAILISHPNRGVDLGASQFIKDQILSLRNSGVGVLLLSSDATELLSLCDRLVVMVKGQLKGPFATQNLDETKLGLLMGGSDVSKD